jgi:hypothetical protein
MPHCRSVLTESEPPRQGQPESGAAAASDGAPTGSGLARDQAPPQRRYRIITVPGGGFTPFRLQVVPESNVIGMPAAPEPDVRVPDPPAVEPPPDPRAPPPVIRIPAPQ